MLVFHRRNNDAVELTLPTDPAELAKLAGAMIIVTMVDGRRGRIGFEASREITIHRKEVADRIRADAA